jgi:hypothetical protein
MKCFISFQTSTMAEFDSHCCVVVVSPSGYGKSTFVMTLLEQSDTLFTIPFKKVLWCSSTTINNLQKIKKPIEYHEGLPSESKLKEYSQNCVIIDDLQAELASSRIGHQLCSKWAHHWKITVFFLLQSFFWGKDVYMKQIVLNSQYIIFMACRRNGLQIKNFLQGVFPDWREKFLNHTEICQKPFSHVLYDFRPATTPSFVQRTDILLGMPTVLLDYKYGED